MNQESIVIFHQLYQLGLKDEENMLEDSHMQKANTKATFLQQEFSRHGNKPRSIKSWLKENNQVKEKIGYNVNLSNLKGLSNFIFTNCTQIHITNHNKDDNTEAYVAINALLDGGSEVTLILDSVASECNLKILGVVDLVLSTVSGNIKNLLEGRPIRVFKTLSG